MHANWSNSLVLRFRLCACWYPSGGSACFANAAAASMSRRWVDLYLPGMHCLRITLHRHHLASYAVCSPILALRSSLVSLVIYLDKPPANALSQSLLSVINLDLCCAICPAVAVEKLSCGPAEELLPALHDIQQEPAWPSIVAGHRPQDWPDNVSPTVSRYHQDVVHLSSKKVLKDEAAQAIHSFYTFMLVSPM